MSHAQDTLVQDLAARIQHLEDRLAIQNLLLTHPFAIDGGAGDWWLQHWTEDAVVDRMQDPEKHSGDYAGVYGKELMRDEIRSPELEALRQAGLCHFVTPPAIQIQGDAAYATNYLQLLSLEGNGYRNRRTVISRWDLRREDGCWQITRRTIRALGHPEARKLVLAALPSDAH